MADYTLITNIKTYIGASTDTKQTVGIPAGSLAFETDTGILYILHGSTWYVYEGILKFTPSTAQVIDAAGDVILANATMVVLNPDADHTLTSTPTIADGVTGQILILTCANNEAHTVTIQDQDTLGSSNLQLLAATRAITGKMGCMLYFDGSDWIELGSDEFASIVISGLTASRLVSTSATKALESSDATAWIAGTANQITVTDDTDGSVTLSTPQDIAAASSPSFAGITLTGTSIYTPSTTQVIDAAADAILANATVVVLNPDDDYILSSTPTIANGIAGQILYITCANAETNTVILQDQDTLAASNLQLLAPMRAITGKTVLKLVFDGTNWVERGSNELGTLSAYDLGIRDRAAYRSDVNLTHEFQNAFASKEYVYSRDFDTVKSGILAHIDSDDQGDTAAAVWGDGRFIYLANHGGGLHTYSLDAAYSYDKGTQEHSFNGITLPQNVFITVTNIRPTGDGTANDTTDEVGIADATNNRLFNRSTGGSDTQDMDWYCEWELPELASGITTAKIYVRANDYASCVVTWTWEDQAGNADATGPVTITPTGNDTWEEFTYTFTSAYTSLEHVWSKIAITGLDTGDTVDFGGIALKF